MIQEYIDRVSKNHQFARAEWMEEQIKEALGPFRWWLIETTNWMWLAKKFDVVIHVRMVPDGELVTINKHGEIFAQQEFNRKGEEVHE